MKKSFPDYTGKDVFKITLNLKDRKIIDDFLTEVRGSAGEHRTHNIERIMIQVCDISQTPLDKWDYSVLCKFLELLNKSNKKTNTINDIKKALKRFLKFYYQDWSKRFRGLTNGGIQQKKRNAQEKISKEKLLSVEDIQKLISGCDKFYFKALFSLFWDTSARPSEILNIRWEDLDLENNKIKITRFKTGNISRLPLDPEGSIIHLENHKNNFIFPDVKPKDYIFPSPRNRNQPISSQAVQSYLNTIGKKTIGRNDLFVYLFRHTHLNMLRKVLSPDMYEQYADHSLEVGMEMYGHNDDEDLETEMFDRVFKTKKLTAKEKEEVKKLKNEMDTMKADFGKFAPILEKIASNPEIIKILTKQIKR